MTSFSSARPRRADARVALSLAGALLLPLLAAAVALAVGTYPVTPARQAFACASKVALPRGGITSETMKLLYGVDVDIVGVGATLKACVPRSLR